MKHNKQLEEAKANSAAAIKELEHLQNEKRKMLMEHETAKLKELDKFSPYSMSSSQSTKVKEEEVKEVKAVEEKPKEEVEPKKEDPKKEEPKEQLEKRKSFRRSTSSGDSVSMDRLVARQSRTISGDSASSGPGG